MIEILPNHIVLRPGNNTGRLDEVLLSEHITTKRSEQLLMQGGVCKYVYFIVKGCLQVYVHKSDFKETTRDIIKENNWYFEIISFGSGSAATENIRVVEPSRLFAIDRKNFKTMVKTLPQFDKVYKQILEASYANSVCRINTFVSVGFSFLVQL